MPSFNLLRERWLPVITLQGEPELLSLHELFVRAHELRCLRAEAPVVTAALHRLLLAFLHRAHVGPDSGSDDEWVRLWKQDGFDPELITRYGEEHPDGFELLGGDRPFMQCPGLSVVEPKPATQLLLYRAKGNNTTLFDHTTEGERPDLPADVAARWLVTLHAFDTGGTKTPYRAKGPKSSKSGLGNHFATVLLEGEDLKQTLLLNMVTYAPALGLPMATTHHDDRPVWELERPPDPAPEEGAVPRGWTDLLTWPSRRILLQGRDTAQGPVVDGAVIAPGSQLKPALQTIEAMAAFRKLDRKQPTYLPVRLELLRGVWRHARELLLPVEGDALRQRPLNVQHVAEQVDAERLDEGQSVTLRVFGQQLTSNPGAVEFWSEEALPVKLSLLRARNRDWPLEDLFGYAVGLADDVGTALQDLTKNYSKELRGNFDPRKHDGYLAERYWPRLDTAFAHLLRELGDLVRVHQAHDPEGRAELARIFEQWRAHVDGTAQEAARTWVDEFTSTAPRQLLAVARAEMIFLGALRDRKEKYQHDVGQYTR
ncbi:type I-E CRISPR-associated protein Cse1/CasA [Nocardiopsis dassonvillei]|uniref:type I-E CRISPR-associated protein Cse1/CasA n=1 Tax=Nocardiopsis dassonvillei TaxID=2014 RepID=UPI00366B47A2